MDSDPAPHSTPVSARGPRWTFAVLYACYAVFLLVSLPRYGPTWDVFYEFPRATAYVSHMLGEETPSDVSPWHHLSYEIARSTSRGSLNGCLPSLIAAVTGKIFFEKLQILGYIDAYHLGLVLLWLLFILHFHARLGALHDARVALVATILIALAPRVLGHVPNNMKDVPAMAFATAGLLELAVAITQDRPRRIYWTALFVACAMSSKFVAGVVALPGAVLVYLGLREGRLLPRIPLSTLIPLGCIPIATIVLLIAHWPYLWVPPSELPARLGEIRDMVAIRTGTGASVYPFVMALITTPLPLLIGLVCAGIGAFWKPAETKAERLLLVFYAVWMLSVLAVFSSGRIALFDGIRHFLLFVPPAAILSAWGLIRVSDALLGRLDVGRGSHSRLRALVVSTIVLASAVPIALYHPYEVTYFNALIGGLPGATELELGESALDFDPRDYWGTSVRASVEWANQHLPANATLFVSIPPAFARINPYPLRSDLIYGRPPRIPNLKPHYLVFVNRPGWFTPRERRAIASGELVHQEEIRGVPLSFVYRWPNG